MVGDCLVLRNEGVVVQSQILTFLEQLDVRLVEATVEGHEIALYLTLMIDHVNDVLVASKFVSATSSEIIGSTRSSTRDSSIEFGMYLIGRYFLWLRIPLNGLNKNSL